MESNSQFFTLIISWCWLTLTCTNAARILAIFPIAAKSHFSCNEAMMRSLHNAGHEITFVSPFASDESLKNYSVVDTRRNTVIYIGQSSVNEFHDMSMFQFNSLMLEHDTKYCKDVLSSPEIQALMNSTEKHYDVMFTELIYMFQCYLPLAEKLNIPVIGTVTLRSWKFADIVMGNPYNPAVVPGEFTTFSDKMTFMERFNNFARALYFDLQFKFAVPKKLNEIYDQFYTSDLVNKKQISLVFTNNHLTLLPRPVGPNIIDVGGIHIKPAKSLPENYQKFIDEAEHGVVLFSFGSVLKSSTLDPNLTIAFRDAFAQIPQRVIWKFEESIENLTDNVMLTKWMPQRDILAHKNVKAFMSHCGLSGTYEGLFEGIPMIFTPLFADQMSNAALLERLGVGLLLDVHTATKEKVLHALNAVINDTRYRDTMKKVSERFKDRPMSAQESIVYWTEYVIRHNGAPYMAPSGANMPLHQYLLLDIFIVIIITIAFSSYIVAKIIKKVYHFFENHKYYVSIQINKKQL